MLLNEYLENPMGKGSAVVPNKKMIQEDFEKRYNNISDQIKMNVFYKKISDSYYFHFVVPSETERNNTYDVVIEFSPNIGTSKNTDSIKGYDVRFFSNSPSFIYTHAYAFNKHELLIKDLKDKINKKALTQAPVVRNSGEVIGYEKTVYFSALYLKNRAQLFSKTYLETISSPYRKNDLLSRVRMDKDIKKEIAAEKTRLKEEKEQSKTQKTNRNQLKTIQDKKGEVHIIKAKKSSIKKITGRRGSIKKK